MERLSDEELDKQTRQRLIDDPTHTINVILWVRSQRQPEFGLKEAWDYVKERQ